METWAVEAQEVPTGDINCDNILLSDVVWFVPR